MPSDVPPILAEIDIWILGLSRSHPDPLIVRAMSHLIDDRRLFMIGWIRQGVLSRLRDMNQFTRVVQVLSPFPDLPIQPVDHLRAAIIAQDLQQKQVSIQPAQCLLWAMAERVHGVIWTRERRWKHLARVGAPLMTKDQVDALVP